MRRKGENSDDRNNGYYFKRKHEKNEATIARRWDTGGTTEASSSRFTAVWYSHKIYGERRVDSYIVYDNLKADKKRSAWQNELSSRYCRGRFTYSSLMSTRLVQPGQDNRETTKISGRRFTFRKEAGKWTEKRRYSVPGQRYADLTLKVKDQVDDVTRGSYRSSSGLALLIWGSETNRTAG